MGHLKIDIQFEKKIKNLNCYGIYKDCTIFLNISFIFNNVMGRYDKNNKCSCQSVKIVKK